MPQLPSAAGHQRNDRMDAAAAIQAISSVGFPIVACIGLFYLYDKTIKELTNAINKIDNTLQQVMNELARLKND